MSGAPAPKPKPRIRVRAGRAVRTRICAIGDAHDAPGLSKDRFDWIGRYVDTQRPDIIVQIGDFLTLDSVSTHAPAGSMEHKLQPTFREDINSGAEALGRLNDRLGYSPDKIIVMGNHEHRALKAEVLTAHLDGMYSSQLNQLFADAGWRTYPYGALYQIGGVSFTHVPLNRMGKPYGGKTAAQQIANDATTSIVFGHSHVFGVHSAPKLGQRSIKVVNLGSALPSGHIEPYARHSLTGWTYGICMLDLVNGDLEAVKFISMQELEYAAQS